MEKHRAIPKGYMTVGEVAKKMDVTVRTLQHYDREGLLRPSAVSEGGRRLYTDKDIIKLHQILSFKHLGFSLDDIKNRLSPLDTPAEVASILAAQADAVRQKIENLSQSLKELEALREEVLQMQTVNFKKYADIIVNLQMKNDFYWLIKHFDDQTLDHIRGRFDKESGKAFMERFLKLQNEAIQLQNAGIPADSEEGQQFANLLGHDNRIYRSGYGNAFQTGGNRAIRERRPPVERMADTGQYLCRAGLKRLFQ